MGDFNTQMYNYYRGMYDTFSGNPQAQTSILNSYFDFINPMNQQKMQQQAQFDNMLNMMLGSSLGGTPQVSSSPLDAYLRTPVAPNTGPSQEEIQKIFDARKRAVQGLYTQGVTDPNEMLKYLNFDDKNNLVGDFTPDEINSYTAVLPKPEEGHFGLGGGKGELFGQGGLAFSLIDPLVSATTKGIINPIAAILQTGAGTVRDLSQGKSLTEALANPENAIERQAPLITGKFGPNQLDFQKEYDEYMKNPALSGTKAATTLASYALPLKIPVAGMFGKVANPILKAGLQLGTRGAAGSGLLAFGRSAPGQELQDALKGTLLGGTIGFGLGAGGSALGQLANKVFKPAASSTPVLDRVNATIQQNNLQQQVGGTGQLGKINPSLNLLSGNQKIEDIISKAGLSLSAADKAALARELLDIAGDQIDFQIPSFLKKHLQQMAADAPAREATSGLKKLGEKITANADNQTMSQAEAFGKSVTGEAPKNQNWLQKTGVDKQYKELGYTAPTQRASGSLSPISEFNKAVNTTDQALDFFDLQRSAKGIDQLPARLGALEESALLNTNFSSNIKTLLSPDRVSELARNAGVSTETAQQAIMNKVNKIVDAIGNSTLDEYMRKDFIVGALDILNLKRGTAAQANAIAKAAIRQGTKQFSVDQLADQVIHNWAKNALDTGIPGMKAINQTWQQLYRNNPGIVQAFNTGMQGTNIASPAQVPMKMLGWVNQNLGKGMEGLGNLQQGISERTGSLLNRVAQGISDVASTPGAQAIINNAGRILPFGNLAPLLPMGISQSALQGQPSQGGDVLGMSTGGLYSGGEANTGFRGLGMGGGGFGGSGMGGGISDSQGFKTMLGLMVLSGKIDPSTANTAVALLGLDSGKQSDAFKAKQAEFKTAENAIAELKALKDTIGLSDSSILANLTAGPRDLATNIGLDPDLDIYRDTRAGIAARIARALGETGPLTDRDIIRYLNLIPDNRDTKDQFDKKIQMLERLLRKARAAYASGGVDDSVLLSAY